jgi:chromate transporter
LKLGFFAFGTGSAMPMYERAFVRDAQWLDHDEFQAALTLAQVLPGPSLVSLSVFLGNELLGVAAALLGVLCMCIPGALWGLTVIAFAPLRGFAVQELFHGFAIGALVLLVDLLWRLRHVLAVSSQPAPAARAPLAKQLRRWFVAAGLGLLVTMKVPVSFVAALGVAVCLLAEFLP